MESAGQSERTGKVNKTINARMRHHLSDLIEVARRVCNWSAPVCHNVASSVRIGSHPEKFEAAVEMLRRVQRELTPMLDAIDKLSIGELMNDKVEILKRLQAQDNRIDDNAQTIDELRFQLGLCRQDIEATRRCVTKENEHCATLERDTTPARLRSWIEIEHIILCDAMHRRGWRPSEVTDEMLFNELASEVVELIRNPDDITECADIIAICMLYAQRKGWDLNTLDQCIVDKLRLRFTGKKEERQTPAQGGSAPPPKLHPADYRALQEVFSRG